MKKVLFIAFPLFVGLSSFAMMDDSKRKRTDDALELVIKKLPFQLGDPVKEMTDTEEEDAFELLTKSSLTTDQRDMLSQAVGVYSQIVYDFPFAYPNYDNVESECSSKILQKYRKRLDWLNESLYENVEWI